MCAGVSHTEVFETHVSKQLMIWEANKIFCFLPRSLVVCFVRFRLQWWYMFTLFRVNIYHHCDIL